MKVLRKDQTGAHGQRGATEKPGENRKVVEKPFENRCEAMIEEERSQRENCGKQRLVVIPKFAGKVAEGSKSSPPMRAAAQWNFNPHL
jgi:hypothetical protein